MYLLAEEVAAYLCVSVDYVRRAPLDPMNPLARTLKMSKGQAGRVRHSSRVVAEFAVARSRASNWVKATADAGESLDEAAVRAEEARVIEFVERRRAAKVPEAVRRPKARKSRRIAVPARRFRRPRRRVLEARS